MLPVSGVLLRAGHIFLTTYFTDDNAADDDEGKLVLLAYVHRLTTLIEDHDDRDEEVITFVARVADNNLQVGPSGNFESSLHFSSQDDDKKSKKVPKLEDSKYGLSLIAPGISTELDEDFAKGKCFELPSYPQTLNSKWS